MERHELEFGHRKVCVYETAEADAPVVYSLDFKECGEELLRHCAELGCRPFNLVSISNLHWDAELSPWPAGKIISKSDNFNGEADTLLQVLTQQIVPQVEEMMGWRPSARVLAGYSMSGLFSLYTAFNTQSFTDIVSASGSLWFPDIVNYVDEHNPSSTVRCAYFSIGDLESKTKHPYMKTTETNTQTIAKILQNKNVETFFELNPGNHFKESTLREAKGIAWVLRQE